MSNSPNTSTKFALTRFRHVDAPEVVDIETARR
jgi:hypothetical protein